MLQCTVLMFHLDVVIFELMLQLLLDVACNICQTLQCSNARWWSRTSDVWTLASPGIEKLKKCSCHKKELFYGVLCYPILLLKKTSMKGLDSSK